VTISTSRRREYDRTDGAAAQRFGVAPQGLAVSYFLDFVRAPNIADNPDAY